MKHFPLLTALSLSLFACALSLEAQKFRIPYGFKMAVKAPSEEKADTQLEVSWQKIENALLYELEFAELYQEDVKLPNVPVTLSGNSVSGLGSAQNSGAFEIGSHLKIIQSTAGNDGIYKISSQGLTANSLTLENAKLNPETISSGRTILLKVQPPQWVYFVQKASVFDGQPTRVLFKDLTPGAPYIARIRAIAISGEDSEDPQSDFTPATMPVHTARQIFYSTEISFESITTHSLQAVWSTPENSNGSPVVYEVTHSATPDFNNAKTFKTEKTQHVFNDLKPETSLYIRVQPLPKPGKYSQFLKGGSSEAESKTLALKPIALKGVVSTAQSALGSLMTEWPAPANLGNENISYKLVVRKSPENANDPSSIIQTHSNLDITQFRVKGLDPLSSYNFEVQAFPMEGNKTHLPSPVITGTGTTAGSTLESPSNFEATPGIGSLKVSWGKVINNLGAFQYKILIQDIDGSPTDGLPEHFITKETELGPIENLKKETEYQVTIIAEPLEGNKGDLPSIPISVLSTTLTDEVPLEDEPEEETTDNLNIAPANAQPEKSPTPQNNPN